MVIVHTVEALRAALVGKEVGFVPTMGYLHEGHVSLVEASVQRGLCTVMSIFVNPTQFGPNEDYARYPRDLERDSAIAKAAGVDVLFVPEVSTMYAPNATTVVEVGQLDRYLCGQFRPGHFKGVATVVAKLFNIVQPHEAFFGQKDAQQVAIIKAMVRDLHMTVQVVACPTLREADGLAKSSRNIYLSPAERAVAPQLYAALSAGVQAIKNGIVEVKTLKAHMLEGLSTDWLLQYLEVVDSHTLQPLEGVTTDCTIAVAAYLGKTRLIDNVSVTL